MVQVVVLGAGLGGVSMALEVREQLGRGDVVTVVSNTESFQFTPSNPWLAVNWRKPEDITVPLAPVLRRKGIEFLPVAAERVEPMFNRIKLVDGREVPYDYLVIATGPELAFDEVPGMGPGGHSHSICTLDHASRTAEAWEAFCRDPGPLVVGTVQGVSCFGPAYEYAMIVDTELRRRKIRDRVPMTFVTSEPYIGHLGLGGVGDTKGLLESAMRDRHIKWIVNAKTTAIEANKLLVTEVDEDGKEKKRHEVPFKFAMMMPAFRGIKAVAGIEGLVNPRGFVLVDKHQRNPKYRNVFSVGVCIAIPPAEATPVPTGVPKTGFMIESMVTATARNIRALAEGKAPTEEATWNAICLADFGDTGVAFVAQPQIPPRNVNWASEGRWVHMAKIGFEKYFLRKVRHGQSVPLYERLGLKLLGIEKLRARDRERALTDALS
ncbi:MAG TPA: FAD/NAD(P)-binding oxidoreductase [Alphaproteobacteria bacterium]|jgi:sulfide:quinone oxidoreductase|nr:FAD/NAD(P)-binding oxidoreductase [Alphaproteobacteria bacterium]